ncbi:hypothetical protein GBA52_017791 [Prunus armeniaca]|nr:hypothetical protein GBA52_017791 [Prunus armeniaca]
MATMLNGAAITDGALLLIAANEVVLNHKLLSIWLLLKLCRHEIKLKTELHAFSHLDFKAENCLWLYPLNLYLQF